MNGTSLSSGIWNSVKASFTFELPAMARRLENCTALELPSPQ
jgi:hypothetical protein